MWSRRDYRGIDVALVYDSTLFNVIRTDIVRFEIPKSIAIDYIFKGRDILEVEGVLNNQDTIVFFVNHWPSRSGGLEKTEPRRLYTAAKLKNRLNQLMANRPSINVILMGDFNDEPGNTSIATVLGALPEDILPLEGMLYNCFSTLDQDKRGSYNYRGNWNMLDQIMVSSALLQPNGSVTFSKAGIIKKPFMLYEDPKFGMRPSRTYGGPNYYGGFSDHLPVYIDIQQN
jgi:hypothetical protein